MLTRAVLIANFLWIGSNVWFVNNGGSASAQFWGHRIFTTDHWSTGIRCLECKRLHKYLNCFKWLLTTRSWTKCLQMTFSYTFCRKISILGFKFYFTYSQDFNRQQINICWSSNGLAPDSQQANIWTDDDLVQKHMHASLDLNMITGLVLGLRTANERRRYFVTTFLIGWVQA